MRTHAKPAFFMHHTGSFNHDKSTVRCLTESKHIRVKQTSIAKDNYITSQ